MGAPAPLLAPVGNANGTPHLARSAIFSALSIHHSGRIWSDIGRSLGAPAPLLAPVGNANGIPQLARSAIFSALSIHHSGRIWSDIGRSAGAPAPLLAPSATPTGPLSSVRSAIFSALSIHHSGRIWSDIGRSLGAPAEAVDGNRGGRRAGESLPAPSATPTGLLSSRKQPSFALVSFHVGLTRSDFGWVGTWHLPLGTWHLALGTWHLPLATRHSPLATCHLPLGALPITPKFRPGPETRNLQGFRATILPRLSEAFTVIHNSFSPSILTSLASFLGGFSTPYSGYSDSSGNFLKKSEKFS